MVARGIRLLLLFLAVPVMGVTFPNWYTTNSPAEIAAPQTGWVQVWNGTVPSWTNNVGSVTNFVTSPTNNPSNGQIIVRTGNSNQWTNPPMGGALWATVVSAGTNVTVLTNSASGTNNYTVSGQTDTNVVNSLAAAQAQTATNQLAIANTNLWDPKGSALNATNGLGSAAFTASSAFDAAGTALNATNGLGSAAFTSSSAYDVSGAAQTATNQLAIANTNLWDPKGAALTATNQLAIANTNLWDPKNSALNATNGLGSAAFTSSGAYDPINTALHATNGLGSAAFVATSAFDASGTALNATNGITSSWIQGKFPSVIMTNNGTVAIVYSNTIALDAAHALSLSNLTTGHVLQVGANSTVSSVSSGAVPIDGDGSATTSAQVQALFPSTILTNNYASGNASILLSNAVAIDKAHALTLSNLTASRHVMSAADNTLTSATASGAVPIDADGSATTSGQVQALFPSNILTNNYASGNSTILLSNAVQLDAAHSLTLSNLTTGHVTQVGANSTISSVSSGAVPIDGDGTATTSAQIQALFPGTILTNNYASGNSAIMISNAMKLDAAHSLSLSNLTASRTVLSGADNTLLSAAASGAVPIDADGSATTFTQINALAPGLILTNNLNTGTPIVLSNGVRMDASHQLVLSNITVNHMLIAGNDSSIGSATGSGPFPINADSSLSTQAQIMALVDPVTDLLTYETIYDSFSSGNTTTATIGALGWQSGSANSATITIPTGGVAGHYGVIQLTTGTLSGATSYIALGDTSTISHDPLPRLDNVAGWTNVWTVQVSATNDVGVFVGILGSGFQAAVGQPQTFIGIAGVSTNNGHWVAEAVSAGTATRSAFTTAFDTAWHTFRIWCTSGSAGTISFSIDNGTAVTLNSGLPSVGMNPGVFICKTAANNTVVLTIDTYIGRYTR